jgi:hypothetical protein
MAFLTLSHRIFPIVLIGVGVKERAEDVRLAPFVELLHEALWFLLFGHG